MAAHRVGDAGPEFGLVSEASLGFAQAFEQRTIHDEAVCDDNIGEAAAVDYYNQRTEGSASLIKKSGATLPSVLTNVAFGNLVGVSKVIITELSRKPEQKGYTRYDYTFKAWANITLS